MTDRVAAELDHAVRLRLDTPGDAPYPATVGEVADEVVAWIRLMESAPAQGLGAEVLARLTPEVLEMTDDCGHCDASWRLCRGLLDRTGVACCADCAQFQTHAARPEPTRED